MHKGPSPKGILMAHPREDYGWEGWWLELGVPITAAIIVAGAIAGMWWLLS